MARSAVERAEGRPDDGAETEARVHRALRIDFRKGDEGVETAAQVDHRLAHEVDEQRLEHRIERRRLAQCAQQEFAQLGTRSLAVQRKIDGGHGGPGADPRCRRCVEIRRVLGAAGAVLEEDEGKVTGPLRGKSQAPKNAIAAAREVEREQAKVSEGAGPTRYHMINVITAMPMTMGTK